MAIQCKLCGKELDALAGGRCRKCRQLVCQDCMGQGSPKDAAGLLCRQCVATSSAAESPVAVEPEAASTGTRPARGIPIWGWVGFGLFLFILFFLIVYYPALKARQLAEQLSAKNPVEAEHAAQGLVDMGGLQACKELARVAETGPTPEARMLAIEALGRFAEPLARTVLQRIESNEATPPDLRLSARDALASQKRFRNR